MTIEFYRGKRSYVIWKSKLYGPEHFESPSFAWKTFTCRFNFRSTIGLDRGEQWMFEIRVYKMFSMIDHCMTGEAICRESTPSELNQYEFYLSDKDGNLHRSPSPWSWPVFELETKLEKKDFLIDGLFVLVCLFGDMTAKSLRDLKKAKDPKGTRSTPHSFAPGFEKLLGSEEYSDVVLNCGDKVFPAHRNILTARSEVFAAMFRHDMSETRDRVVSIPDIRPDIMQMLLRFIYTSKLDMPDDVASLTDLYQAADKYALLSLRSMCSSYLRRNVTKENARDLAYFAHLHDDSELWKTALSFQKMQEFCYTSIACIADQTISSYHRRVEFKI